MFMNHIKGHIKLKDKIKKFPKAPGVYFFKDKSGKVLYIGKATNLKSRASSYLRSDGRANVDAMMDKVCDIKFQETDTVLEALILEANLIKKYQPKYNVMGKDDKSYAYFVITKEDFPRILILRKTDLMKSPFRKRGLNASKRVFRGDLKNKFGISNPSLALPFQKGEKSKEYSKIYGPYTSKQQMQIALKIMRRIFPFHNRTEKSEKGCLSYQVGLCPGPYDGAISKTDYKKNIRGIRMILEGKRKSLIKKLEKEMKEYSARHDFEHAAEVRNKIFSLKHIQDIALISERDEKSQISNLKSQIFRIEAYDISNISGEFAVGSMVVFDNSQGSFEPNKNEYRKFKIRTIKGANDVGMMREVLKRRFKNNWKLPDLIILDGGKGHVNMGEKILKDFGLRIPIAGVAKGPKRKNLELSSPRRTNSELRMDKKNILKNKKLLKQITDEAHRFAIRYHRKLREKGLISGDS
jgi:excinuclease ABC subunit C